MAELETEVAVLKDWRIKYADPMLQGHQERLMQIEDNQNQWKGSLKVILWMNRIIIGLLILLVAGLFGWALNHVQLRVENIPASFVSEQPKLHSGLPSSYQPR